MHACMCAGIIQHVQVPWVQRVERTIYRRFGYIGDRRHWSKQALVETDQEQVVRMPAADTCLRDSKLEVLSSAADRWVQTRAVMTETILALSKSKDSNVALHVLPLHEIVVCVYLVLFVWAHTVSRTR